MCRCEGEDMYTVGMCMEDIGTRGWDGLCILV